MFSGCAGTAFAKSGFTTGFLGMCHERTVPSREAETMRLSVGEHTART